MKKRTGRGKSLCALIVFALLVSSAVYYKYDEVRANSSTKKAVAADSAQPGGETAADTAEEPSEVVNLKLPSITSRSTSYLDGEAARGK